MSQPGGGWEGMVFTDSQQHCLLLAAAALREAEHANRMVAELQSMATEDRSRLSALEAHSQWITSKVSACGQYVGPPAHDRPFASNDRVNRTRELGACTTTVDGSNACSVRRPAMVAPTAERPAPRDPPGKASQDVHMELERTRVELHNARVEHEKTRAVLDTATRTLRTHEVAGGNHEREKQRLEEKLDRLRKACKSAHGRAEVALAEVDRLKRQRGEDAAAVETKHALAVEKLRKAHEGEVHDLCLAVEKCTEGARTGSDDRTTQLLQAAERRAADAEAELATERGTHADQVRALEDARSRAEQRAHDADKTRNKARTLTAEVAKLTAALSDVKDSLLIAEADVEAKADSLRATVSIVDAHEREIATLRSSVHKLGTELAIARTSPSPPLSKAFYEAATAGGTVPMVALTDKHIAEYRTRFSCRSDTPWPCRPPSDETLAGFIPHLPSDTAVVLGYTLVANPTGWAGESDHMRRAAEHIQRVATALLTAVRTNPMILGMLRYIMLSAEDASAPPYAATWIECAPPKADMPKIFYVYLPWMVNVEMCRWILARAAEAEPYDPSIQATRSPPLLSVVPPPPSPSDA